MVYGKVVGGVAMMYGKVVGCVEIMYGKVVKIRCLERLHCKGV